MKKILFLLFVLSIYGCAKEKKEEPKVKFSDVYNRVWCRYFDIVDDYFYKEMYLRPGQKIKSRRGKKETRKDLYMQMTYDFNNETCDILITDFNKNPQKYNMYYIRMRDDDGLDYDVDALNLGKAQESGLHVFRYSDPNRRQRIIEEKYGKYKRYK